MAPSTRPRSASPPAPVATSSSTSPTSPRPDPSPDAPLAKRQKVERSTPKRKTLPYDRGMHLAPMVRIGTLPVRLLALEYGAEIVWGPEIVDKALIGATRSVDPKSGVVSFIKNKRSIFECHPIEKPRLIFQLGSADPKLAVEAMKVIEQDVAGVGLNCGCPKSFSLQGGMGAALLKDPERLCSILKALVAATDLPIDAKIRLLPLPAPSELNSTSTPTRSDEPSEPAVLENVPEPVPAPPRNSELDSSVTTGSAPTSTSSTPPSEEARVPPTIVVPPTPTASEPTIPLVEAILSTGISNLTVHCRTQTMRSSEPALHRRMLEIARLGYSQGIPVVCNGDASGGGPGAEWGNFDDVCQVTGTRSVMIARAAEANVSCFRREGFVDPIKEVIPRLIKIGVATGNHFANSKYILNAINLHLSPTPPSREVNRDIKLKMNKAKTYEDMGAIFGIDRDEVERSRQVGQDGKIDELVPAWMERRKEIVAVEGHEA
ncbi:hypothetical protein JCM10212_000257 [Sporobolomyces blumeae]